MPKNKVFSKTFQNWTCADDCRIQISQIETKGLDLEDFLSNAEISFEDWHGNCTRESWSVGDLSQKDYAQVERLFVEYLAQA
jgi:hypothetical protein